jgi:N-acyl-D-aspartate/D-glutamate deacylase
MGQAAGPPTSQQLDTMRAVVRHAMEDGAFGISSALIYPPGSFAGPGACPIAYARTVVAPR